MCIIIGGHLALRTKYYPLIHFCPVWESNPQPARGSDTEIVFHRNN